MKSLSLVRQEKAYVAVQTLHREKGYPVVGLCGIIGLNRSSYYKWLHRDVSEQEKADEELIRKIQESYEGPNKTFGHRRMQLHLGREFGIHCNKKRVYRVMSAIGMRSVIRRKKTQNNYERSTPEVTAENVLCRNFKASSVNEKRLTDVTEMKCGKGGKLFLSAIPDLKDKSIVSYQISRKNDLDLVFRTFDAAIARYPEAKPLFHSDRGSQYTSKQFKAKLDRQEMLQSMSRPGRCHDNAPMESFWGTLKSEMYYLQSFSNFSSLKAEIDRYIDFYNTRRYQTGLGGLAPLEYRRILVESV